MATIYQRGKEWWGSYTVNGRRKQLKLNTRNGREALAWKQRIEAAGHMRLLPEPTKTPLVPLCSTRLFFT